MDTKSKYRRSFSRSEMDSDSARHILQRRGPGGLKHIEIRCLASHSGYEKNVYRRGEISPRNIWDGPRTQSLARKRGLRILEGSNDDSELLNSASSSSRGASILSFNTRQTVRDMDTDLCTLAFFLFLFLLHQVVYRPTQISCTIHSRFSVHSHWGRNSP